MAEVYINKISKFLPNTAITNEEMETVLGKIAGKASRARRIILRSNGIKSRYYVIDKEQNICYSNAEITANAVKNLEFNLDDLDLLSCGTTLPDQLLPNHAVMVHGELKSKPCEVVATSGICLSGMTALKHAYLSVKASESSSAIATGSETSSTLLHARNFKKEGDIKEEEFNKRPEIAFEKDFLRWMLSDGAGAMLVQNKPNKDGLSLKVNWLDIISFANEIDVCMYAGGEYVNNKFKGYKEFTQEEWLSKSLFSIKQDVKLLNANIVDYTVEKTLRKILEKRDLEASEVTWFLPHYSSEYFRDEVAQSLKNANFEIPQEKWFTNLSKCGNTGSASMYIMLEELFNNKQLNKGEKILCYVPESGRFSSSFMLLEVV
ncbi:MAG TPA: StlD/DarB family beta-ketosynthase [Campylobacterales bacterium]|nr:StlD/DarB family beta-ketosynthase [Campylobacterales bacterium]